MRDIRVRDSLPNAVARLFRRMVRIHNKALKPFGLSAIQAHVLSVLWLEGPQTIGELQATLALKSSTLTGTIDRMEKAELLRRVRSEQDRRAVLIEPAPWEPERRSVVLELLQDTEDACFAGLTARQRADLLRLLAKANVSLERVEHG